MKILEAGISLNKIDQILHHLFSATVAFLEQEFSESRSIIHLIKFRILPGLYLLMGIFLSNAYKNTNLYNMISQRTPVPYKDIEELVSDGFQIYSRPLLIGLNEDNLPSNLTKFKIDWYHLKHEVGDISTNFMVISSEVHFAAFLKGFVKFTGGIYYFSELGGMTHQNKRNGGNATVSTNAFLKSQLDPDVTGVIQRFTELSMQTLPNIDADDMDYFKDEVRENITNISESDLLNKFSRCDKSVARILPVDQCHKYAKILHTQKSSMSVSISEETYFDGYVGFYLGGLAPPTVMDKFVRAEEADLWEQAASVDSHFQNYNLHFNYFGTLRKPSMNGNIQVIFLALGGGLIGASVGFCLELYAAYIQPLPGYCTDHNYFSKMKCNVQRAFFSVILNLVF